MTNANSINERINKIRKVQTDVATNISSSINKIAEKMNLNSEKDVLAYLVNYYNEAEKRKNEDKCNAERLSISDANKYIFIQDYTNPDGYKPISAKVIITFYRNRKDNDLLDYKSFLCSDMHDLVVQWNTFISSYNLPENCIKAFDIDVPNHDEVETVDQSFKKFVESITVSVNSKYDVPYDPDRIKLQDVLLSEPFSHVSKRIIYPHKKLINYDGHIVETIARYLEPDM